MLKNGSFRIGISLVFIAEIFSVKFESKIQDRIGEKYEKEKFNHF